MRQNGRTLAAARGFSMIELLVVLVIIGTLASVAIPGLLNARQRSLQKRTLADLRGMGLAVEAYIVDNGMAPRRFGQDLDLAAELSGDLTPTYTQLVCPGDGWLQPLRWSAAEAQGYTVASWGKDGLKDASAVLGATTSFNADIYFSNGVFRTWPEGTQN